jgi:opacity protein-like surface antigen
MKSFTLLAVSLVVCASVGCASTSDVRIAKNEALDAAQEADARSARSEEMLNRGFKRAMYK